MKWSAGVVRVVDEATLTSCENVLVRVQSRVNASPAYTGALAAAVLDWMKEIWPSDEAYSRQRYVVVAALDIDRMPMDLIQPVSQKLLKMGATGDDPQGISARAAGLIACWLRTRMLQAKGHIKVRPQASLLKRDYESFFAQLMAQPEAADMERAAS